MTYRIEITTHRVSYRDADGEWLDGDRRELEPAHTEHVDADEYNTDGHDDVVSWAVDYLNRRVWPTSASVYPLGERVDARTYLTRTTEHPYREETEEVTAYLTGAWTDTQRARIFRKVLP